MRYMSVSIPSYSIRRVSLVYIALLTAALIYFAISTVVFAAGNAQVWGQRNNESQGYSGAWTYMTTPNPSGLSLGEWAAGPTGTRHTNYPFMESGPTKACDLGCGLHPYAAWATNSGNQSEFVDTSVNLQSGGWYQYKNFYVGSNKWQAQWCDGGSCYVLSTPDLGTGSAMPYVFSGGESSDTSEPIGSLTTSGNKYIKGGSTTFTSWCYTSVRNNVSGSISSCGGSQNWNVSYD